MRNTTVNQDNPRIFVSPAEAAEMLGISRWSMYELIRSGAVASGKSGNRRLVRVDSIHDYADKIVTAS